MLVSIPLTENEICVYYNNDKFLLCKANFIVIEYPIVKDGCIIGNICNIDEYELEREEQYSTSCNLNISDINENDFKFYHCVLEQIDGKTVLTGIKYHGAEDD